MSDDEHYFEKWKAYLYLSKAVDDKKPGNLLCDFLDKLTLDIEVKNFEKSKQIPSKCTRPAPND